MLHKFFECQYINGYVRDVPLINNSKVVALRVNRKKLNDIARTFSDIDHWRVAVSCCVAKLSSCRRLRIAGLARAIQMRLPYLHRCSPVYCLKDRPCCRFFYPWPYHAAHSIRRRASFLPGRRLLLGGHQGSVLYVRVYVQMGRHISVCMLHWRTLQMQLTSYKQRE